MGKKRRKLKATQKGTSLEGSNISRLEAIERADSMIQAGDPESAIKLLKPLAERYKRDGRVQYYLGYSYVKAGRVWEGIPYYKKALEITRDPELWFPLGYLYLELDMRASARKAFQQVLRHGISIPSPKDLERDFALLDEDIRAVHSKPWAAAVSSSTSKTKVR